MLLPMLPWKRPKARLPPRAWRSETCKTRWPISRESSSMSAAFAFTAMLPAHRPLRSARAPAGRYRHRRPPPRRRRAAARCRRHPFRLCRSSFAAPRPWEAHQPQLTAAPFVSSRSLAAVSPRSRHRAATPFTFDASSAVCCWSKRGALCAGVRFAT